MKKLLVYGGSFNPIHNGHKKLLLTALKQIKPDTTLLIPNYVSPFKALKTTDAENHLDLEMNIAEHKKAMLEIFIKTLKKENIFLDDFEINKKTKSYTIDTIHYLKQKYPDHEIYLLIGGDSLVDFDKWKSYDEILDNIKALVVGKRKVSKFKYQKGKNVINENSDKVIVLKSFEPINISSTQIRENKINPNDLDEKILEYINNHGVYALDRILLTCKKERVLHSLRVLYYARLICEKNKVDKITSLKAEVASIYHDIAKDFENEILLNYFDQTGFENRIHVKTMHGYVGAYILEKDFLFKDQDILNAIRRHTLPFEFFDYPPTLLDKIIYLADKLEYKRTNEDVCNENIEYYRDLSFKDIDKAFDAIIECFKNGKQYK